MENKEMITKSLKVRGYKGVGKGSKFIKWFTFGDYSHVSMIFEFTTGHIEEIEAIQGSGVIKHEPKTADEAVFDDFMVPITPIQVREAYDIACSKLGAKYDWAGIWGFVRRKKKHSNDKWFCSELVAYVLWQIGYKLSRRKAYKETPSRVMESLRLVDPKEEYPTS